MIAYIQIHKQINETDEKWLRAVSKYQKFQYKMHLEQGL